MAEVENTLRDYHAPALENERRRLGENIELQQRVEALEQERDTALRTRERVEGEAEDLRERLKVANEELELRR